MKKSFQTIASLKKQLGAKDVVLNSLRGKLSANALSDEAKANAEAIIAEKEAEIQAIKDLIAELEASEEDKSEELNARIAELSKKIDEIENSLKEPKGVIAVKNFIDSKNGAVAFMNAVRNSANGADFKSNWNAELVKNGITPTDLMLPGAIVSELNDAWENSAENFLQLLDVTGLKVIKVAYDSNTAETSRAQGHKRGTAKHEQVLTFVPKEVRPQIIYKYITIDRETELEDENGVLARYIARELAYRILHEIMRAILVGDGRLSSADDKISKFETIVRAVSDAYVSVSTAAADVPTKEEIAAAVDSIEADGDIVLFVSKQTARALSAYYGASGATVQYKSLEELAMEFGVAEIRTTSLLGDVAAAGSSVPRAVAFVGKAYKVVGDLTMQGFEDFVLSYNKKEYLTEVYAGGGLCAPKAGAVVWSAEAPTPEE